MNKNYTHGEAYCLMKYASKDGSEVEYIWNSRDGVTPFIIHSRSGIEMYHVDWKHDRCIPNYEPKIGERIFVDLTPMRAKIIATEILERNKSDIKELYDDLDDGEIIQIMVDDMMKRPGEPDLIEVRP